MKWSARSELVLTKERITEKDEVTMMKTTISILAVAALVLLLAVSPVSAQSPGACGCTDLVFIVDDTGSMGPSISNIKAGLASILATASTASAGDLQIGLVSFKDNVNVRLPFTANQSDATTAVNALLASGGAGEPESSDEAVKYVASGAASCLLAGTPPLGMFRAGCTKIAVLVTDARPAGCDDTYTPGVDDLNAKAAADLAAAAGIRLSAIHVNDGNFHAVEQPIMMYYASSTGGVYVEVPVTGEGASSAIDEIVAKCGKSANECPRSQGFWKTHAEEWPVDSLTIGGVSYDKATLLNVLNTPVRGNAVLILAHQLIATELNIANGSDPAVIATARAAAQLLLTGVDIKSAQVRTNTATGQQMTSAAGMLDNYNNRMLTPDCESSGR